MLAALERAGGSVGGRGGAADLLGVRPSTLKSRMKALGVEARRPGEGARQGAEPEGAADAEG